MKWVVHEGLTGVGGGVQGVVPQLVDVHLHSGLGGTLHQGVGVLSCQSQCQTFAASAQRLIIQNGGWKQTDVKRGLDWWTWLHLRVAVVTTANSEVSMLAWAHVWTAGLTFIQ